MTKLVDLAISGVCPPVILILELETLDAPLPVKTLLIALGIAARASKLDPAVLFAAA